jgi:hypothetical protein
MVKLRASVLGSNFEGASTSCNSASRARTGSSNSSARGVGRNLPEPRMKSSSPSCSRSRPKALDTADWVRNTRSAARVTLRSSITASKTTSRFRSRRRRFMVQAYVSDGINISYPEDSLAF